MLIASLLPRSASARASGKSSRRPCAWSAPAACPNRTDSMFTTIEGDDWDEVMAVVKSAVDAVASRSPRVSLVLKADLRPRCHRRPNLQVDT